LATYEFYNPSVCARQLGLANCWLAFTSLIWLNHRRLFLVVLVISTFWTGFLTLLLLILIPGDFLAFLPLFLMFGGQNGVITFFASLQDLLWAIGSWLCGIGWWGTSFISSFYALLDYTQICYIFIFFFSLKL
jgi:hypothetical protein